MEDLHRYRFSPMERNLERIFAFMTKGNKRQKAKTASSTHFAISCRLSPSGCRRPARLLPREPRSACQHKPLELWTVSVSVCALFLFILCKMHPLVSEKPQAIFDKLKIFPYKLKASYVCTLCHFDFRKLS